MRVFYFAVLFTVQMLLLNVTLADDELYVTTRSLTAASAVQAATTAEQTCAKKGYKVAVAVVDRQGNLLAFVRNPLSGNHTIKVAQAKAYTSATLLGATLEMTKTIPELRGAPGILLLGGGLPIQVAGQYYGAIGVAGAPPDKVAGDIDEACARAGIARVAEKLEFAD